MRTLALGKADTAFYRSLGRVLPSFGEVIFRSEHDLGQPEDILEVVRSERIDRVLMPNPYGNERRLGCYRLLRERGITVVASDRGALPASWFFDRGFNADSPSYDPAEWDHPLDDTACTSVQQYIATLRGGATALESQGPRRETQELRGSLGIGDAKVLFLPLQRPGDTVVRYFSGAVSSLDELVRLAERAVDRLNEAGEAWRLVLKKHPLETETPELVSTHAVYADAETHVHDLLELSDAVLVLNSGVGLLALLFGKPTFHVGDAFYGKPGLAARVSSVEEATAAIRAGGAPSSDEVERFAHHLLTRVYSFADFVTQRVRERNGAYRTVTRRMIFKELRILGEDVPPPPARVLVVSPVIPWPIYRGSQSRVDAVLRSLCDRGLEVSLAILNMSYRAPGEEVTAGLRDRYPSLHRIEVFLHPRLGRKWTRRLYRARRALDWATGAAHRISNAETCPAGFGARVRELCREIRPDYLFVNYAKLTPCVPADFDGVAILDTHDYQTKFLEEDQQKNRIRRWVRTGVFRESEHEAVRRYDRIIAISPLEMDAFSAIAGRERVYLVPAFSDAVAPAPTTDFEWDALFVASMSNFNVTGLRWFLSEVLPMLRSSRPGFRLAVAGNIQMSKQLDPSSDPGVEYLGIVDDLSACYRRARVVIAPILGGAGMKIKVVEALAHGKAVVCTPSAAEGIGLTHRENAWIADGPSDFGEGVLRLSTEDELRSRIERGAVAHHRAHHSAAAVATALARVLG